jgi:hypothetical protein
MKLFAILGFTLALGFTQDPPPAPLPTPPSAPTEADKAATELLKKAQEKILSAKAAHIEFRAVPEGAGGEVFLDGDLKWAESGKFHCTIKVTRGGAALDEFTVRSDGLKVLASGGRGAGTDVGSWKAADVAAVIRHSAASCNFLAFILSQTREQGEEKVNAMFTPKDVKSEGKEKVDGIEASVVTFGVDFEERPGFTSRMALKLWIDPATLSIVKRSAVAGGTNVLETIRKSDLDAKFPADFFEFQSATLLKEGLALQLSRSVSLHARFTGRLPKSLEDLRKRPADLPPDVFWPEGGFWIGGAIPKDLPYSWDASTFTVGSIKEPIPPVSPVGAPTERLKKVYSARVTIQLLQAAGAGYTKAFTVPPALGGDLLVKSEWARFWPEGGWIGAGKFPVDPWGLPYVIRAGGGLSIVVSKPKGKFVKAKDVTAEERKALDLVAVPRLPEKDEKEIAALIPKLGADGLEERDEAEKSILGKGAGALHVVADAAAGEKNPEIAARLAKLSAHFRSAGFGWERELKGSVPAAKGGPATAANERNAWFSVRTLCTAQADFRSNDRDGNRVNDFWVRDVAGFFGLEGATGAATEAKPGTTAERILKIIEASIAKADATEGRLTYPVLGITEPEPKAGYLYAALKHFVLNGKEEPYHKGDGRNRDCFGFVAFPADYGTTGRMTFIVNENNEVWQKDLEGDEVDTFPANPEAEGWTHPR